MARHQAQAMTVEQARQFLEALFTTAILTGMCEGELLALHWSGINFEQRYLQVRRNLVRPPGNQVVESEPKTASANCKIVLSSLLIDVLRQQHIHQLELRLQAGKAWEEHGLVFTVATGGHLHPATLLATLRRLLREIGLQRMSFHDLKRSAAILLLARGVHPKVLQELLGHNDIMITQNIYSHVLPSLQEDAMDKLSGLFGDRDARGEENRPQEQ
jgi:integrase